MKSLQAQSTLFNATSVTCMNTVNAVLALYHNRCISSCLLNASILASSWASRTKSFTAELDMTPSFTRSKRRLHIISGSVNMSAVWTTELGYAIFG